MIPEMQFVSEDALSTSEIKAGLANQSLVLWRTDGNGKRWFKRLSLLALPVTTAANLDELDGASTIRAIPQRKEIA